MSSRRKEAAEATLARMLRRLKRVPGAPERQTSQASPHAPAQPADGAHAGETVIQLDYPVRLEPRWGDAKPFHPELHRLLLEGADRYRQYLRHITAVQDKLALIGTGQQSGVLEPVWVNGWIPALDSAALYAMLAATKPQRYVEIGSGNSTMFARRAIRDHGLATTITSIDPAPRADIDQISDRIIRSPLEDADLSLINELDSGDVLFFDGSHRCFTNSDVTVMFMEILPRLLPGVHVQIHDIWLPGDYRPGQVERYYSEQYLLGVMLLAGGMGYEVTLPCWLIYNEPSLAAELEPVWTRLPEGAETFGCSFWMRRVEHA